MSWYVFGEIINSIIIIIGEILCSFVKVTIHLSGIPTSEYGFVKFVISNNLLLYNNKTVTAIILIIVPLIVTFIISKVFKNISSKNKNIVSIILYLLIVHIISMINIWILLAIIVMLLFCIFINKYVKYKER